MDYIMHDSQNSWFREPFGAVAINTDIRISIEADYVNDIYLHITWSNNSWSEQKMDNTQKKNFPNTFIYTANINSGSETGLLFYYFKIIKNGNVFYYGNNDQSLGGVGKVYQFSPNSYQITVFKECSVPKWYKEGIIYQIFVDRFYNGNENHYVQNTKSNRFIYGDWNDKPMYIKNRDGSIARWDFFGGNLKGVIEKLGYLKELGISIIYLNPIFEAASSHKYDTGDYKKIDPMFGDEEIFKTLCKKANELGIHIILDGVFSHTGSDSRYFNKEGNYDEIGAYQSRDSKYYSWYQFDNFPNVYRCWWGIQNQPNTNELTPSFLDYIINDDDSVLNKWMTLGADGWRLDVADELPDEFIFQFKKKMKENKDDSVLIGEVWEDASNKESYGTRRKYFLGEELDSTMGYPFRKDIIDFLIGNIKSGMYIQRCNSIRENYPHENYYSHMNLLGTHDTERILTLFADKRGMDKARKLLFCAVTILMTFPGVPHIYYGDEAGLQGEKDPDNRRAYQWGHEDEEILSFYKKLIAFRNNSNEVKKGSIVFEWVNDDIIKYSREFKKDKVIVIVNRNEYMSFDVCIDSTDITDRELTDLITGKKVAVKKGSVSIKPLCSYVLF